MMTAVLPLISPEKGTQLGFIAQGLLLVVSGVYYPVEVLPEWMQWLSVISPATYALDGMRDAIIDGAGITEMWDEIWPLIVIGIVSVPLGLEVFRRGERYAKRHGKLKRSGCIEVRRAESDADLEALDSRTAGALPERVRGHCRGGIASWRNPIAYCSSPSSTASSSEVASPSRSSILGERFLRAARPAGREAARGRDVALERRSRRTPSTWTCSRSRPTRGRTDSADGVRRAIRLRGGRPAGRAGVACWRRLGPAPSPLPEGVEVVSIAERPELLARQAARAPRATRILACRGRSSSRWRSGFGTRRPSRAARSSPSRVTRSSATRA